jgi:hypothetical protein
MRLQFKGLLTRQHSIAATLIDTGVEMGAEHTVDASAAAL